MKWRERRIVEIAVVLTKYCLARALVPHFLKEVDI